MVVVPARHPKHGIIAVWENDIPKFSVRLEQLQLERYQVGDKPVELWPGTRYQSVVLDGKTVVIDGDRVRAGQW